MTEVQEEARGWRFATYLGDAVYALSNNGCDIHLRLDHHDNANSEIVLEPQVLKALDQFRKRIAEEG